MLYLYNKILHSRSQQTFFCQGLESKYFRATYCLCCMFLSLLSIVYGALRCNILAIKIKYDEYDVKVKPLAYVCIVLWRSFEIATRVIVLVLFTSVLHGNIFSNYTVQYKTRKLTVLIQISFVLYALICVCDCKWFCEFYYRC